MKGQLIETEGMKVSRSEMLDSNKATPAKEEFSLKAYQIQLFDRITI